MCGLIDPIVRKSVKPTRATLLVPVENQVRELEPKLLLACIAAKRGFTAVIGSHREIDLRIASFPRSLYICKSFTVSNLKMFQIIHRLGHKIVSWDEEALVHLPPEMYFSRRLSPLTMRYVSNLFAWGEDNAELWRQYSEFPAGLPIHITGNPRNDMLRPEMRAFYESDVEEIRNVYGEFILVNTNFNHVNSFSPVQNLFQPVKNLGEEAVFGKAARGMTREYAEGLRDHKQAVLENFQRLIPALEQTFPNYTIIVRPHPTESQDIYNRIAAQCERVRVTNEGNVVPWLMATKAVILNGCTTGVEAYVMGVPAISYRTPVNDFYDHGFYRLPNLLSHQCFDFEELRRTLSKILAGELGVAGGAERKKIIEHYLAAGKGPLACERIIDVLEQITQERSELPKPALFDRFGGWCTANGRSLIKRAKAYFPSSHNRSKFQRHRYPGIPLEEMRDRARSFQQLLDYERELRVQQLHAHIFRISA
jgi:surface carbohydrate biosynthesis protein